MKLLGVTANKDNIKWTTSAIECYLRHCVCKDCPYMPEDLKPKCQMKNYVLLIFAKWGKPESPNLLSKVRLYNG